MSVPSCIVFESYMLTGDVYALPASDQIVHSCGVMFVNVPVYDSPCVLTEKKALELCR